MPCWRQRLFTQFREPPAEGKGCESRPDLWLLVSETGSFHNWSRSCDVLMEISDQSETCIALSDWSMVPLRKWMRPETVFGFPGSTGPKARSISVHGQNDQPTEMAFGELIATVAAGPL